jgi:hypothetical protein
MRHSRKVRVFDACWNATIDVVWGLDLPKFVKLLEQQYETFLEDESETEGQCVQFDGPRGGADVLIYLRAWRSDPSSWGTLAHECFHACNILLAERGQKFDPANDEAYAYFFSSTIERIGELIEKKEARLNQEARRRKRARSRS